MSYTVQGGNLQTKATKLTTANPTVIAGPSCIVVAIYAAEISNNTPTLAIYKTDGTTSTYLRGNKAMTAYEEYSRDVLIVLKANETLVADAGAGNQVDVIATYIPSDKTAKGSA